MAYSVTPTSGINLDTVVTTNPNSANANIPTIGPLGLQVFGSDGKRYVLAKAIQAIGTASTNCIIGTTAMTVTTGTAGTYTSPSISLASGDVAWFSIASV